MNYFAYYLRNKAGHFKRATSGYGLPSMTLETEIQHGQTTTNNSLNRPSNVTGSSNVVDTSVSAPPYQHPVIPALDTPDKPNSPFSCPSTDAIVLGVKKAVVLLCTGSDPPPTSGSFSSCERHVTPAATSADSPDEQQHLRVQFADVPSRSDSSAVGAPVSTYGSTVDTCSQGQPQPNANRYAFSFIMIPLYILY